jgi:hypothetical protein
MKRLAEPAATILYMKIEAAGSYECLATLYQATIRHTIEDHNLDT